MLENLTDNLSRDAQGALCVATVVLGIAALIAAAYVCRAALGWLGAVWRAYQWWRRQDDRALAVEVENNAARQMRRV